MVCAENVSEIEQVRLFVVQGTSAVHIFDKPRMSPRDNIEALRASVKYPRGQ